MVAGSFGHMATTMMQTATLDATQPKAIEFPEAMAFLLFESARFKVVYGGRGAGKTENIARALIMLARAKRLRIACFRDIMKSVDESVISTIRACIYDLGYENEFDIQKKAIIHKATGSEFLFLGLRYNINSIKSLARIDIAWVEEATPVNKNSWDKLGPTIRGRHEDDPNGLGGPFGKGPEIWVSFNPELDSDETYKRFVMKQAEYAPDFVKNEQTGAPERYAFVKKINWSDNKWFPPDLKRDMMLLKQNNEEEWLHIWEGNTKQVLAGAVYAKQIKQVLLDGRRGKIVYDPSRPVYTFWDLGHNDHTAIWFIQTIGLYFNIIHFYQNRLEHLPHYVNYMQGLGYNYGMHYLPHDADNDTLASRSVFKLLLEGGHKVRMVKRPARKFLGINACRTIFDLCNFDEEGTQDGWQCLCRYHYNVDENDEFSKEPEHDRWSHGADAFQTFGLHFKSEAATKKPIKTVGVGRTEFHRKSNGWMAH